MVLRVYCYIVVFLAIALLFPATPRLVFGVISFLSAADPLPLTARVEKQDQTAAIPNIAGTERIVAIDSRITYIGTIGGATWSITRNSPYNQWEVKIPSAYG